MVILGLGSNVGDRLANLRKAVADITPLLTNIKSSSIYESKALLPAGSPSDWDNAFLNMVICGGTTMEPHTLLKAIKDLEDKIGRKRRGHWAPREIDIDILAMDDETIKTDMLAIPHPEMLKRDFVMVPLAEILPNWVHPEHKKTASELVKDKGYTIGDSLKVMHESA
ncbi:MAG: 2-amino-4-hydroxy-6-hydroxymethyldihydropteridine diphosphokinase [Rickettsiales bacterium]